ncbi:LPXTG cell wall anchor domain-containing protein [Lacticaseibacillus absianus]|uniref:LPXTG cell wall anchor domain-containing protein n=1 Tax=Lacticaseibacillus absianus TaxID=2729623 RepID=UPI0015C975EF|nr:LPXTG cell wall anchor domain-containing protein [Lacticaseibacillus absianus]
MICDKGHKKRSTWVIIGVAALTLFSAQLGAQTVQADTEPVTATTATQATIAVEYRDTATNEVVGTLDLTDQYDTEFATRSQEIGQNIPTGYTLDQTRLPDQLPMYFGDPTVTALTFYVKQLADVTIPVEYRDTATNQLVSTLTLTAQYDTEFSTRSQEIGQNIPTGYTLDQTRLPEQLPMYFGDPAVPALTVYVKQLADVTIPVEYRDTATNQLVGTLTLTAQYDTEFSTRSQAIGQNIPAGYTIDQTRLPVQLPMYFGDPAVTRITLYVVKKTQGGHGDNGNNGNAGDNGNQGNSGHKGNGSDQGHSGNQGNQGNTGGNGGAIRHTTTTKPRRVAETGATPKQTVTDAKGQLPQTGDEAGHNLQAAGALTLLAVSMMSLLGVARRKKQG